MVLAEVGVVLVSFLAVVLVMDFCVGIGGVCCC